MTIIKAHKKHLHIVQKLMKNLFLKQIDCYWNELEDIKEKILKKEFYLIIYKKKYIGTFSIRTLGNDLMLPSIAIIPKYRKKGYGKQILEFIEKYAKKSDLKGILLATLRIYNVWKFYEKCGFKRTDKGKYCNYIYYEYYKEL